MGDLLSLTRAARLVGETRVALQKKIKSGEMTAFDGMVTVESLLSCYPNAQLEDDAEFRRISQIKEQAFGKRVFERALPDAEVLAARITELSKTLANTQAQVKQFERLLGRLWDKFKEIEDETKDSVQVIRDSGTPSPLVGEGGGEGDSQRSTISLALPHQGGRNELREGSQLNFTDKQYGVNKGEMAKMLENLKLWIKHEVASATEPGFSNPLAIKDGLLRVMAAQITVLPSKQDFLLEGQDTLLEAAMRAGIPLNYGCSGGNCGLCKAKVVSGQVKKTRTHDFVISEADKNQGCILLCSNTAVSDVVLEAAVAGGVQDIPFQQISAKVKATGDLTEDVMLLHLQTPRTQRLRFLAGQNVTLRVGQSFTAELPIASCPCDDRNLLFHLRRLPGNLFSDYVFDRLKNNDVVEVEGPQGEFILHEKSPRPLYFFAFDGGFAPIKSVVEHAMSLEAESIHLYWIGSNQEHIYLPNIGRAWGDALDNFHYEQQIAGFDLRNVSGKHEEKLVSQLSAIVARHQDLMQGDIYLAGPESAAAVAEQFFLGRGLPKTRVSVGVVK